MTSCLESLWTMYEYVHVILSGCIGYVRAGVATLAVAVVVILDAIEIAYREEQWQEVLSNLKDMRDTELDYQNEVLVVSNSQVLSPVLFLVAVSCYIYFLSHHVMPHIWLFYCAFRLPHVRPVLEYTCTCNVYLASAAGGRG